MIVCQGHLYLRCELLCSSEVSVCIHVVFFFKQKTAYEVRISDWSSDVCSSDLRCVATLIGKPAAIETLGGMLRVTPADGGAEVTLGEPAFEWERIPLAMPMDTRDMPVAWDELEHGAAVNVGNPHIVFFVPEADAVALGELGPRIETDPLFPERVNVNVASLDGENQLQLRVWERGVGLTQACGTGACATAVAAIRAGLVQSPVTVSLPEIGRASCRESVCQDL